MVGDGQVSLVDQLKIDTLDSLQDISVFPDFLRPVEILVIRMLQALSLSLVLKITSVKTWVKYNILKIYAIKDTKEYEKII